MTDQRLLELAACPFCGSEAERVDIDPMQEEFANAGGAVIQCKSCGASSPVHFDRKENLDASWNTRALSAECGVKAHGEPSVHVLDDELLIEWQNLHISVDDDGFGYAIKHGDHCVPGAHQKWTDAAREIRSALVPGVGEPVAWRVEGYGAFISREVASRYATPFNPPIPLYTHPAPPSAAVREALEKACRDILPYLRWTISDESPGHHPTMPSAVAAFQAALGLGESSTSSDCGEKLGRFGHHPDPAIDFCVEVEDLVAEWLNTKAGFENGTPARSVIEDRVFKAMQFRVGGDPGCVTAKQTLREIEREMKASPTPAADREAVARIIMRYAGEEIMTDELAHLCADAILSTGAGR